MSQRILATDGLPARDSGPWAEEKLTLLDNYGELVTTALKGSRFPSGLSFVDLMAGPGVCIDTHSPSRRAFKGSTLRALDTTHPFNRIVAIESNAANAAALRDRVAQHARSALAWVEHADCNAPTTIELVRELTRQSLTLMFVDLIGTEVSMQTIRAIAAGRAIDLVITWPEMDVLRNKGMLLEPHQRERWSSFFGTEEFEAVATSSSSQGRPEALQRLYVKQLGAIGFEYTSFERGIKNGVGRAIYRPLFASKHPLGDKFWTIARPKPKQGGFEFE